MAKIKLTKPQSKVYKTKARFKVISAGRRFGKTFFALIVAIMKAGSKPHLNIWYIAPTYRQAKQLAWKMLKTLIPRWTIAHIHETELSIELKNGSTISLKGADKPDSLRGCGLHFIVFDEAADIKPDTWFVVIRPALADTSGDALFIGTPKGFNWFYDLFLYGQASPGWAVFQYTTAEGGNVSPEELELARSEMSEKEFAQEFLASFQNLMGTVYSNFDRNLNVSSEIEDIGSEVLIGMDFNVNPMSAVVGCRVTNQLHIFDEIELSNSNTEEMAQEIKRRYPGRTIIIYPDPSGKSRKTSSPVGETDFAILRKYNYRVISPKKAPLVVDRVNEVQAMLCNAKGDRRLYIHPRCKRLIKCMEGLIYKENSGLIDKSMNLDHLPDGLGYLIHSEFPIISRKSTSSEFLV